jgi:hypothetical protein
MKRVEEPGLYSKQRKAGKSRLFLAVFINTVLEDGGQIRRLFASALPSLGRWGWGPVGL